MDKLFEVFTRLLNAVNTDFKRYLIDEIDWSNRMIVVTGPRGCGKTTMLLQYIKTNFEIDQSILYVSLDDIYFTENKLIDLADSFVKNGGKFLFIDEIHKYPNWSIELKNIYDNYIDLKIIVTGSSILNIYKGFADLSRRAVQYSLPGLSFREFLNLNSKYKFQRYSLQEILKKHIQISMDITQNLKIIPEFKDYLQYGYYPYFIENKNSYQQKLSNTINTVLESDMLSVNSIEYKNVINLKKLLYVIAQSVPFKANVTKLSERIGISRNTLVLYLDYLNKAQLITNLYSPNKGYGILTKPEKLYLNNPNIIFAIAQDNANIGNVRETFFLNQMSSNHKINISEFSDFLIDNKYTFEVGGKNKTGQQIQNIKNSYLAIDEIETGYMNKIPLWLFGFMY
jgi:hypothetical protein